MRHIRNFFHNINDIILAVVIVAVAAGIIYWRMQIILDYPKQLAEEQAVYTQEEPAADADTQEEAEEAQDDSQTEDGTGDEEPAADADAEEQPQG